MKHLLFLVFIGYSFGLFSQTLKYSTDPDTLLGLSKSYYNLNTDSAIFYGNLAYLSYKKMKNHQGESTTLNALGIYYCYLLANYDTAEIYFLSALDKAKQINDTLLQSKIYGGLGEIEKRRGNYDKSFTYTFKSLSIAESLSQKDPMVLSARNLDVANILLQNSKPKESINYIYKGLVYANITANQTTIANAYNSLSSAYIDLSQLDSALFYANKNIAIRSQLNDYNGLINGLLTLADINKSLQLFNEEYTYAKKALILAEKYSDNYKISNALQQVGVAQIDLGKINEAITSFLKSAELSKKISATELYYITINDLAQAYYLVGDYKNAYEYYRIHQQYKNSLITNDYNTKIAEAKTKYETEKKEIENKKLVIENNLKSAELIAKDSQQRTILLLFLASILIVIVVVTIVLYKRKIANQKRIQEQEKLQFKAIIETEEKERIRIAKELHDGLGQLLSTAKLNVSGLEDSIEKEDTFLLHNVSNLIDEAVTEVRNISHSMMPVALTKLGLKPALIELTRKINDSGKIIIKTTFDYDQLLHSSSSFEIAIYRIVQEILNNIIKHSKAKEVQISLIQQKENLSILITDNGIGFDVDKINDSKGIGWQNIFSRTSMLNGKIHITSSIENGTEIAINVPLNLND